MKKYVIDCGEAASPRDLHRAISREMAFPDWYGNNLDALYDILTSLADDTELTLLHVSGLGSFAVGFCHTLQDAAEDNPHFHAVLL